MPTIDINKKTHNGKNLIQFLIKQSSTSMKYTTKMPRRFFQTIYLFYFLNVCTQGFAFGFAGYILTSILGLAVYSPHEFTFRAEAQVSSCTVGLTCVTTSAKCSNTDKRLYSPSLQSDVMTASYYKLCLSICVRVS